MNQEKVEDTIDNQKPSNPEEGGNCGNDSSDKSFSTAPTEEDNTEVQPMEIGDKEEGMLFERFRVDVICRK